MSLLETPIMTLAGAISKLFQAQRWRLATAESCTGGGLAYALTQIAGSSAWFERGWVTYSDAAKQELLGVPANILQQYGAVSKETAAAMVKGALIHSPADIALSITGIAGPAGGTEEKPVGTVWFGIGNKTAAPVTIVRHFTGDRMNIRQQAIIFALGTLITIQF